MSLPFASLENAASLGAGSAKDLETVQSDHTMIISATGLPAGFVVHLEGSHDDVTWIQLGSANEGTLVLTVTTHLVRYVRANWISVNGGTSPTVTATIASR
jgi:hypothetical protein